MKKQLLSLSLLFTVLGASAQITITSADVAVPNKLIYQSNDTLPTISAGSAGTSQTWNMSALNSHTVDTLNFISPGWTPFAGDFPGTNLAVKNGWGDQYGMATNSSGSLTVAGNAAIIDFGGGPSTIRQHNTPAEILVNFPSNYLSSFSNNFTTEATFYFGVDPGFGFTVDSIHQKSIVNKTKNCDAWGNISTPLGTFAALRFLEINHHTDSTFLYVSGFGWNFFQETIDSSKKYSWWANSVGFPIVETDIDWGTGAVSHANWLQALPVTGINEAASVSAAGAYPNPASDALNFKADPSMAAFIELYDITGRVVEQVSVENDLTSMNTTGLAEGMYAHSILAKDGKVLKNGKVSILH